VAEGGGLLNRVASFLPIPPDDVVPDFTGILASRYGSTYPLIPSNTSPSGGNLGGNFGAQYRLDAIP
jgi:hypothetical protein